MIIKLKISNFGKFKNKFFDFKPITVFLGKNEAGKTTIFDALTDGLCKVKTSEVHGKVLADRYGPREKRIIEIFHDVKPENLLELHEFLNIYAVHSGSLSLSFDGGKDWIDRVKTSIYSDGIDPLSIAKDLEKISEGRARDSLLTLKGQKEGELKELSQVLKEKKERRREHLDRVTHNEVLETDLKSLEEQITKAEKSLKETQIQITDLEKLGELKQLFHKINEIEKARSLSRILEEKKVYEINRHEELLTLQKKLRIVEDSLLRVKDQEKTFRIEYQGLTKILSDAEEKRDKNQNLIQTLSQELGRLKAQDLQIKTTEKKVWKKGWLVGLSMVLGVSGVLGSIFLFISPLLIPLIIWGLGGISAILLSVFGKTVEIRSNENEIRNQFLNLIHTLKRSTGIDFVSTNITDLVLEVDQNLRILTGYGDSIHSLRGNVQESLRKIENVQGQLIQLNQELTTGQEQIRQWLFSQGVSSEIQYIQEVSSYSNMKKQADIIIAYLKEAVELGNFSSPEALYSGLASKAKALESEIVDLKADPGRLGFWRQQAQTQTVLLEKLKSTWAEKKHFLGRMEGALEEGFRDLPQEIHNIEIKLAETQAVLKDLGIRIAGSQVAKKIFEDLAGDAQEQFKILSKEMEKNYSAFFGKNQRGVKFTDFTTDSAQVEDAEGQWQRMGNLSRGSKDAFLLSVRLSLAKSTLGEGNQGILVLDEPFTSLDRDREKKALELLREFSATDKKWQLIFFTKDESLVLAIKNIFGTDVMVHNLS